MRAGERALRRLLADLPEDLPAFRRACERVEDWDALLDAARAHGVEGFLVASAGDAGFAVGGAAWKAARQRRRQDIVFHDVLAHALRAALDALTRERIPTVALKGPILARRLYADPAARPSTDLDLLVDPSRLDDAARALAPLGYALEGGAAGRFFRDHHHHVHAFHPSLPPLELHFEAYRGFGTVLAAAPLLAASLPCPIPEWADARVLSPEDEFLYLAVHAAGHRLARLVWLVDLKLFLLRYPALDWEAMAARARALSLLEVLSFACAELTDLFDPPGSALARLASRGGARAILARRLLGERAGHLANAAADFLFHALVCEDLARTAAFSARFARVKLLHEAPRRLRLALSL